MILSPLKKQNDTILIYPFDFYSKSIAMNSTKQLVLNQLFDHQGLAQLKKTTASLHILKIAGYFLCGQCQMPKKCHPLETEGILRKFQNVNSPRSGRI
jgi:hypothetical protein